MNDRNLTGKMKENYCFFGIGTALYAGFYALCLYKNSGGIAFTFFIAGSLWFYCLCMKKLEVSLKKGSIFLSGDGDAAGGIDLYNGGRQNNRHE